MGIVQHGTLGRNHHHLAGVSTQGRAKKNIKNQPKSSWDVGFHPLRLP